MLDRLRLTLMLWKWDLIIVWRSCQGRWYIFRDAPMQVVVRFAKGDADFFARRDVPEAVNAINQAREELQLREQVMLREIQKIKVDLQAELERTFRVKEQ